MTEGGTLILTNATLSSNAALTAGGGMENLSGTLTMTVATLNGNSAKAGGGIYLYQGSVSLTGATLSDNTALFGAGVYDEGGDVWLTNATLSGNSALKAGGGIYHRGGNVALINATLSGNSAFEGGGLDEESAFVTRTITLSNTILAAGAKGVNCFAGSLGSGVIASNGYNLSSDGTCAAFFTQPGDLNNTNPHLGPLANYGGPTLTHLPGAGSPAIDAIPVGTNRCGTTLNTDQRGAPRPIHGRCDIGAVEAGLAFPQLWLPFIRR